jgi:hypothetical protein
MRSDDCEAGTVYLNHGERTITFRRSDGRVITVKFSETKGTKNRSLPFYVPYTVAIAQDCYTKTRKPQGWEGADPLFLAAVLGSHLSYAAGVANARIYWYCLQKGAAGSPALCKILCDGEGELTKDQQRGLATELFQLDNTHLFLGPRTSTNGQYEYSRIRFAEDPEPLLQHCIDFFRVGHAQGFIEQVAQGADVRCSQFLIEEGAG